MLRQITHLLLGLFLLSTMMAAFLVSCSEYDTDSVGQNFVPVNSQVRNFTHLVYVEFGTEDVRVWGPCHQEVQSTVEKLNVQLQCDADSLVIIAYGYPASANSGSSGSLTIRSDRNYALYLGGLSLNSMHGPAISCMGKGTCFLVLPEKSSNTLTTQGPSLSPSQGDACLYAEGTLVVGGVGSLLVQNLAKVGQGSSGHAISAASVLCQYKASVTVESTEGDGIHVTHSLRSTLADWDIKAGRNAIYAGDSIVLFSGNYTGSAFEGAYFFSDQGAAFRMPNVAVVSGCASNVMDTLMVAEMFDSAQYTWQEQLVDLQLMIDSSYSLIDTGKHEIARFKAVQDVANPYVLISNSKVVPDMELHIK